jgi:integrase
MPKRVRPVVLRQGAVSVTLYTGTNRIKTPEGIRHYPQWTVAYYLGTKRIRKRFAVLEEAEAEAKRALAMLAAAGTEVLKLSPEDCLSLARAKQELAPFGVTVLDAVQSYAAAVRQLPVGATFADAISFFAARYTAPCLTRTVPEVIVELLVAKEEAGRSEAHMRDLRNRLERFQEDFHGPIASVTAQQVSGYVFNRPVGQRTKLNELRAITLLWNFSVKRRYIPAAIAEELKAIEVPSSTPGEIEVFTPQELGLVLSHAREEIISYLLIGAFAGLRSAEIERLDWADVNLSEKHIEVRAANAKTAARRIVPIHQSTADSLACYAKEEGPVTPFANMANELTKLTAAIKSAGNSNFRWKHNGLRHSFISYRVAETQNVNQTALEAGNSPKMIFAHYRAVVTPKAATEWFAVKPPGRVVRLPLSA